MTKVYLFGLLILEVILAVIMVGLMIGLLPLLLVKKYNTVLSWLVKLRLYLTNYLEALIIFR